MMYGTSISTGSAPLTPYARQHLAYHAKVNATMPQLCGFKSGATGQIHGPNAVSTFGGVTVRTVGRPVFEDRG